MAPDTRMGLTGHWLVITQVGVALSFAALNIGLNFYNAWLLKPSKQSVLVGDHLVTQTVEGPVGGQPDFTFPVFYTMWHMFASVLGASVIMLTVAKPKSGFPSFSQFMKYKWALVAIATCTSLSIGLNNASLTLISLFLNQVIRSTGPVPTMVFSAGLEGKTYGWGTILSCCAIIGSTILAIPFSGHDQQTSVSGVIILLIAVLASSLKPVVMAMVMKGTPERPKLEPTVVLFYDTGLAFWFMLVYWLASNERQEVIDYFKAGNGGLATGLVIAGATQAFLFNLTNYFLVLLTSALTCTVTGNAVKVLNIVISAFITHLSEARNWVGVALVCLSLAAYAYFSHQEKIKPPPKMKLPWSKGDVEDGKASEGTPLKGDIAEEPGGCASCSCVIC